LAPPPPPLRGLPFPSPPPPPFGVDVFMHVCAVRLVCAAARIHARVCRKIFDERVMARLMLAYARYAVSPGVGDPGSWRRRPHIHL